jgi:hypothetical protein
MSGRDPISCRGEGRARYYVERNESAMNTQSNVVNLGDYSRELDQQVEETKTMIHWLTKNNVPPPPRLPC